jgi:Tat protein translocase TatB subunit
MFGIGPQELLLILVIALIVVGPRRLPEISRSIGKGLREIRKAQDEVRKTIQVNLDDDEARPAARGTATSTTAAVPPSDGSGREQGAEAPSTGLAAAAGAATRPVGEISKTLGRGLAELRKARREIERSFRVEDDRPTGSRAARPAPGSQATRPGPARPPGDAPPTPDEPDEPDEHRSAG